MRLIVDLVPSVPALGLAIDEALLESVRRSGERVLRLWVNDRAVVIGRGQGIASEVDLERAEAERVPVLRRISGGGAVVHYPGNLILTAIVPAREAGSVAAGFARWGERVRAGLELLSAGADVAGNCLVISGRKIGGAAQARRGETALYHTTVLVERPERSILHLLLAGHSRYRPIGVASSPRETTTLSEAIGRSISMEAAADALQRALAREDRLIPDALRDNEASHAHSLAATKYGSPTWNASR
jgi:lipoate-protein ligase A